MEKQSRVFPDLLSIDAWHLEFNEERNKVDFHAIIAFDQARLGGKGDVSFTLKLKHARLVVVLPDGFEAPSDSILQIEPKKGLYKETNSKNSKSGFKIAGAVKKFVPGIDLDSQVGATHERAESVETVSECNLIKAQSGFVPGEKVWWDFTSIDKTPLEGPPWENQDSIIMSVIDKREDDVRLTDFQNDMTPSLEVRVVCRREDFDISIYGSQVKNLNPKNIASAEAYICDVLSGKGLDYEGNLSMDLPTASVELVSGFARTTDDE